jgi:hypothetical protein
MMAVNDLLKPAIEGPGGMRRWEQISRFRVAENWEASDHSMHHPYQAGHDRSPSAADAPSAAAVPGGA